jgi:hypothetical protein
MVRLFNPLRSSQGICAEVDFLDNALSYQCFDFVFNAWRTEQDLA